MLPKTLQEKPKIQAETNADFHNHHGNTEDERSCKLNWWSLLKLLFLLALLCFFAYLFLVQVYTLQYFTGMCDTDVQVRIERPRNVNFPAVTVCNLNSVQKSKVCQEFPKYCQRNGTSLSFVSSFTPSEREQFLKDLPERDMKRLRANWENLVPICLRISSEEDLEEKCGHVTDAFWTKHTNCYTFLTGKDHLYGDYRRSSFWITVNFQVEESLGLFTGVAGNKVFIHDPNEAVRDGIPHQIYDIQPGNYYSFSIKQTNYERLPPPYLPGCRNYNEESSQSSSQTDCYNSCVFKKFLSACGCIPYYFPGLEVKASLFCRHNHTLRRCVKTERREIEELCSESCPLSCMEKTYDVRLLTEKVPNYNEDFVDANRERAQVLIKFETNEIVNYVESPASTQDLRIYVSCLYALVLLFLLVLTGNALTSACRKCIPTSRRRSTQNPAL